MIAYFKCLCQTKDRLLAQKLKSEGAEIKITKGDAQLTTTAKQYGVKMPFIVMNDGKVQPL